MTVLSAHVRRRRGPLALTYAGAAMEHRFELLYPFAIGLAINGLLQDSWSGVWVFVSISLAHTAVGVARQRYDARLFNRLYADVATELVGQQRAAGVPTSRIVARTGLAGEFIDFLQHDVPTAIAAGFALVGSLLMLLLYDPILGLGAALVGIPVVLLNRQLMRLSRGVFRGLNDQFEHEVALIETGSVPDVHRHFKVLARQWIRLSDAEATSWVAVDVVALALAVFALVRTTAVADDAGTILAVVAYVWGYLAGFDQLPTVLQRMSNLPDIRRRLRDDEPPA